jgi:hypothetical protein
VEQLDPPEARIHLLPHERWIIRRWSQRPPKPLRHGKHAGKAVTEEAQTYHDAAIANLKVVLVACALVLVTAIVMITVIGAHGGPLSTSRDPQLAMGIVFTFVFWLVVVVGASAFALEIVRSSQFLSRMQADGPDL